MNRSIHTGFGFHVTILICAVLAVYYPILENDFLYFWDDQLVVINRYTEGGLNFNNLWSILTEFYGGQYSPVNQCMYLLIYTLSGYNPLVFHLASLLLHAGCVCLAYITLRRIFDLTNRMKEENASGIAFVTALLFAVHPMNVEAVAWVSASKIVVYAFFYLAATLTWLLYLKKQNTLYYILTLLLFVLSFGGKEQAVSFPVWLLLFGWLLGYSLKERRLWLRIIPFFLLAVVFGAVTMLSQATGGGGVLSDAPAYPLWQRLVLGSYSFVEYLVKFTMPFNLLYIYPFPMVIGEPLPSWMLLYPALVFTVTAALWKYVTKMPVAASLLFFLIHIALVLHLIPLSRFAVIADRYIYLACIGLSFIVAYYGVRFMSARKKTVQKTAIGCFAFAALSLGVYSNLRCRDWKDTDSIKSEIRELLEKRDDYPVLEGREKDGSDAVEENPESAGKENID
ncbi:MAG: hypothetical protein LBV32_09710 [Tannerellaceae bacterium]|jgi:hypothetical protein|nr:hypothetical protein [Tannerellaceae bacterium]